MLYPLPPVLARLSSLLILLGALCGAQVSLAGGADAVMDRRLDEPFGEHEPYRAFLSELQAAVASGARESVAGLVAYPLKTGCRVGRSHFAHPPTS